jgi:hypothetical protein
LATLDTHGLVATETEAPDIAAARRLYAAICRQALDDARMGDEKAMEWLDEHLPPWRTYLSPAEKEAIQYQQGASEWKRAHIQRTRRQRLVQSWLSENTDCHLAIEADERRFYAEIRQTVNDDGDWITRYGVRSRTLPEALAGLGAQLEEKL